MKFNININADTIIRFAEIIGAILVIVGAVCKISKPIKDFKKSFDERLNALDDRQKSFENNQHRLENNIEIVKSSQEDSALHVLRLIICSDEIPLEERIAAGDIYLSKGGNGAVKHKYEMLINNLDAKQMR